MTPPRLFTPISSFSHLQFPPKLIKVCGLDICEYSQFKLLYWPTRPKQLDIAHPDFWVLVIYSPHLHLTRSPHIYVEESIGLLSSPTSCFSTPDQNGHQTRSSRPHCRPSLVRIPRSNPRYILCKRRSTSRPVMCRRNCIWIITKEGIHIPSDQ